MSAEADVPQRVAEMVQEEIRRRDGLGAYASLRPVRKWAGALTITRRPHLDMLAVEMPERTGKEVRWTRNGAEAIVAFSYLGDAQIRVGDAVRYVQRVRMGGLHAARLMTLYSNSFAGGMPVAVTSDAILVGVPPAADLYREWLEYVYDAAVEMMDEAARPSAPEPMNVTVAPVISPTFNNGTSPEDIERLVEALVAKHVPLVIQRLFKGG